ncbi:MAG: hypothetical protein ACYCW6_11805 [Candidatus Xenobia bacterium]
MLMTALGDSPVWVPDFSVIGPATGISISSMSDCVGNFLGSQFLTGVNPKDGPAMARAWQAVLDALNATPEGRQYLKEFNNTPSPGILTSGPTISGLGINPVLACACIYDASVNQFVPGNPPFSYYGMIGTNGSHGNGGQAVFTRPARWQACRSTRPPFRPLPRSAGSTSS